MALSVQQQRTGPAGSLLSLLYVLAERTSDGKIRGRFACDCGSETEATLSKVRSGHTKSCGCFQRKVAAAYQFKHGKTYSKEYRAWSNMKSRCLDPNNQDFHSYGGRGIAVDPAWIHDFAAFYRDMGICPPAKSLDRIRVNEGYGPGNCQWADPIAQANNRRPRSVCREGHLFGERNFRTVKNGTARLCLICLNRKRKAAQNAA